MENEQNIPQTSDFSDIPSLGDVQGLEAYLNNQALAAQGLPVQGQPAAQPQPAVQPQPAAEPVAPATPAQPAEQSGDDRITLTRAQLDAILAGRGAQPAQQPQPAKPVAQKGFGYTPQEQQFIANALSKGYSLEQINNFLVSRRGPAGGIDPILEQRIAQVEQHLKTQEYKAAENAFISRLSDFGNKFGLSEQDLVTFGNEALKNGINIATEGVNLEMVFRAVYPDQYAIRKQRMTPTNSSQIYGGTSIPEGSRASAAKLEDAYVDSFLKQTMPNQYGMLNKK